jgi:hypothetical protein
MYFFYYYYSNYFFHKPYEMYVSLMIVLFLADLGYPVEALWFYCSQNFKSLAVQVLNIYKKTRYNNVCILLDENTQRQYD